MGAIKDVVDLARDLANSVKDAKTAEAIGKIQSLMLGIQSEQARLTEANSDLLEERRVLEGKIRELQAEVEQLSTPSSPILPGEEICPNCSKPGAPKYMSKQPPFVQRDFGITHRCSICNYSKQAE